MGIPGLWDVLGEGEVRHIADYASEHFTQHGRPLRIAVDEATWRFTNLTDEQVARIREGEPAANPIEKTILWRIVRLWRLNIQLLFVYDGMRKPGKGRNSGRGGGKLDDTVVKLLHRMFDLLQVPYHRAPGEAEAECARLQQLGIVDAVWSDDGDSFMFGCTTLIKQHKVKQKAIKDHIRIYRASVDLEPLDFDAQSLVLFALLSGGDYSKGLRGCGPATAKVVSKRSFNLARALGNVETQRDLRPWRASLESTLRGRGFGVEVPSDFPKWKVLEGYRHPAVSTDEQCHNLRGLRHGWERALDEPKLRKALRESYNFTTREYLKHIAPAALVRKLVNATTPQKKQENLSYQVQMKRTRKVKTADGEDAPAKSEVKIMYAAALLVNIELTVRPDDEDWTKFAATDGTPYDPLERVECQIPSCFLKHGLPEGSYETPPTPKKRKSKSGCETNTSSQETAHPEDAIEGQVNRASQTGVAADMTDEASSDRPRPSKKRKAETSDTNKPKKRGRPPKDPTEDTRQSKKKPRKSKEAEKSPPSPPTPPRSQFRHLDLSAFDAILAATTPPKRANVIDLGDDSEDEGPTGLFISPKSNVADPETTRHGRPASPSRPFTAGTISTDSSARSHGSSGRPKTLAAPRNDKVPVSASTTISARSAASLPELPELRPGEVIDAASLRELRMAALLNRGASESRSPEIARTSAQSQISKPAPVREIIDLT